VVSKNAVKEMFKEVVDMFGRVDVVINSAGMLIRKLSQDMSEEEWDLQIDVNLKGTYNSCVEAAPYMKKQRWGRIINIGSNGATRVGIHTPAAYGASKSGILMMSKVLAIEYIPYNINVNVICPGMFETNINKEFRRVNAKVYEKVIRNIPQGRVGNIREDLGGLSIFLASDACQGLVGQIIYVDGGNTIGDKREIGEKIGITLR